MIRLAEGFERSARERVFQAERVLGGYIECPFGRICERVPASYRDWIDGPGARRARKGGHA